MADSAKAGPRLVAIASGKGGAGKSLLAANLGIYLATLNKRVVLLDAAFGSANLHTFIGTREPDRCLSDMLASKGTDLDQVVVASSVPGMGIISGIRDPAWVANPKSSQLTRLRAQVSRVDADYVVIDLGSGTSGATLDLWLAADAKVLVLKPEPTSIELGYRFVRAAFVRRLRKLSLYEKVDIPEDQLRHFAGGIPAPSDLVRRARESGNPDLAGKLAHELEALTPSVVLNFARSKPDMELGAAIATAVHRRMGVWMRYLGHLEYDDAVWVSLRRGRPLLIEHPEARVSKCIEKVARRLLARDEGKRPLPPGDDHYELLSLLPTATDEEIRRAHRKTREIYSRDSMVMAGLYARQRLDALHDRLDEAYDTLMDPQKRIAYDREQFPDGIPTPASRQPQRVREPTAPPPPSERPPMPELAEDTDYTGPLMQEVRLALGLDLRDISERTKIGMSYLEAIESETWSKLPAVVYVRGFLVEYGRMLSLDVPRVLDTYLERYRQAREREAS